MQHFILSFFWEAFEFLNVSVREHRNPASAKSLLPGRERKPADVAGRLGPEPALVEAK
jgi:hypothetical protein